MKSGDGKSPFLDYYIIYIYIYTYHVYVDEPTILSIHTKTVIFSIMHNRVSAD